MSDLLIRPARPDDAEAIRTVIRAAYAEWAERLPDLPNVAGGVAEDIAAGRVAVAENSGILGILIAAPHDGALHIQNLAVSPEASGQGIGSRLMRHAEVIARDRGLDRLRLATHVRMTGNVPFYRRLGWEVTGEEGNRIFMERRLPEPP